MHQVGIIADDLSGALDAAAPFGSSANPIVVSWGAGLPAPRNYAFDSETRQASAAAAAAAVATLLPRLSHCDVAFKKVDSLMRGNTVPELLACCTADMFRSVVIAPAFPQQGRVTRDGRQYAWSDADCKWQRLDADISGSLAARGMRSRLVESGAYLAGEGVFVCNAESDADLDGIAASAAELSQPILWCGTAGLARALTGAPGRAGTVEGERRLAVIGSRHPVSLRQVGRLADNLGEIAWVRQPDDAESAVAAVRRCLGRGGRAALAFDMAMASAEAAENLVRRTFAVLATIPAPDVVVVGGGDTAFRLCSEAGATHLETIGEYSPGVAVSRFVDGAWAGARLVSKAGAFGDDALLARIIAR